LDLVIFTIAVLGLKQIEMVAAVQNEFTTDPSRDNRSRLGTWVLLAAVVMLFTSLTSAYIVRVGATNDWQPLPMPRVLFVSTLLILFSSLTIEIARRRLKAHSRDAYVRWLVITGCLGFAFLTTQLLAWRQLVRQGLYVATNSRSSFFYLLTATHGVHLLGGLLAITYVIGRSRVMANDQLAGARRQAVTDAAAIYWHFMDALWIYLFLLLFFWR
jgi:cytochrome c oxidase subunit 3